MAPLPGTVREATTADVPAVAELHLQHLAYHVQFDPRYQPRLGASYITTYRDHLRDPAARVFVADDHGEIVGFALCRLLRDHALPATSLPRWLAAVLYGPPPPYTRGQIVDFFVREDRRQRGYGGALLDIALDWFQVAGVQEATLGVLVDNDLGVRFWTSRGFIPYRLQMRRPLGGGQPK